MKKYNSNYYSFKEDISSNKSIPYFYNPYIRVTGCLPVPKNLANFWTNMVLLYNLASHRPYTGL